MLPKLRIAVSFLPTLPIRSMLVFSIVVPRVVRCVQITTSGADRSVTQIVSDMPQVYGVVRHV